MNDKYGDGSSHKVCPKCGLCIDCGDCGDATFPVSCAGRKAVRTVKQAFEEAERRRDDLKKEE